MENLTISQLNFVIPIYHKYLRMKYKYDYALDIENPVNMWNVARWVNINLSMEGVKKFIKHIEQIKAHYESIEKHYKEYCDGYVQEFGEMEMPDGSIARVPVEFMMDFFSFRKKFYPSR